MDKLSSSSFFKLTQKDVCNIKETNARDIVKKWFEYLNVKSNKNAKVAQAENVSEEVRPEKETDADIEEFYDMDELMEHRILTEDVNCGKKIRVENGSITSAAQFHMENMSMLHSRHLLKEYEKAIQNYAINDNDPLNVVYAKQRNEANVRENETAERKRLAILTEIFYCLNKKAVKIPDVTKELESLKNFSIADPKNLVDSLQ